jgi:hypothetical protein
LVGSEDKKSMVLPSWQKLANPKALGCWGLKNIFFFSKALAEKKCVGYYTRNKLLVSYYKGEIFST